MTHRQSRAALGRALGISLALLAGCGDSTRTDPSASDADQGGELFVLTAPAATLTRLADGSGTLTLRDPATSVVAFTDRPARAANTLQLGAFLRRWRSFGFDTTPPNAALVVDAAPEDGDVAVLELRNPRLAGSELVYDVAPVPSPVTSGLRALERRADATVASDLGRVSLFVDDASGPATSVVYQQVLLQVSDVAPGQKVALVLSATDVPIGWSVGAELAQSSGIEIVAQSGSIPLSQALVSTEQLTFSTSFDAGASGPLTFSVRLSLAADPSISTFSLHSESDPGIQITASIAGAEPQVVDDVPTLFSWSPT